LPNPALQRTRRNGAPLSSSVMRARKIVTWIIGSLYVFAGVANLIAIAVLPEIREQVISIGAVVFRYSF